jgi:hypothetical protein
VLHAMPISFSQAAVIIFYHWKGHITVIYFLLVQRVRFCQTDASCLDHLKYIEFRSLLQRKHVHLHYNDQLFSPVSRNNRRSGQWVIPNTKCRSSKL